MPGPGLLAHVVASKFMYHVPFYRQSVMYAHDGVQIEPGMMGHWLGSLTWLLKPLVDAVRRYPTRRRKQYRPFGLIEASPHNYFGAAHEWHAQIRCFLVMKPLRLLFGNRPPKTIALVGDLGALHSDNLAPPLVPVQR